MKFGRLPIDEALRAVNAHSIKLPDRVIRKGQLLSEHDIECLKKAKISTIVTASLMDNDVHEDDAAYHVAHIVRHETIRIATPSTGRSNLYAQIAGVFSVDIEAVNAVNSITSAMTLATLSQYTPVQVGQMVATAKIIPFAVPQKHLAHIPILREKHPEMMRIFPFIRKKIGVVATKLSFLKKNTMDKTMRVLANRLAPTAIPIGREIRAAHEVRAVATAIGELILDGHDAIILFGASAVVDKADVLPRAIQMAGGTIEHIGMPVDPGNLLILGEIQGHPIIGAPGCARSPQENGLDLVLYRLLAGLHVSPKDIMEMGVGGLLNEIKGRPSPRDRDRDRDRDQ